MKVSKCVICYKPPINVIEDEEAVGNNNEKCPEKLSDQLRVIFILRDLLRVPTSVLEKHIQKTGNPSGWISTCSRCSLLVDEALFIFSQIHRLNRKLDKLSERGRNHVKQSYVEGQEKSFSKSKRRKGARESRDMLQVTHDVRKYVANVKNQENDADSRIQDNKNPVGVNSVNLVKDEIPMKDNWADSSYCGNDSHLYPAMDSLEHVNVDIEIDDIVIKDEEVDFQEFLLLDEDESSEIAQDQLSSSRLEDTQSNDNKVTAYGTRSATANRIKRAYRARNFSAALSYKTERANKKTDFVMEDDLQDKDWQGDSSNNLNSEESDDEWIPTRQVGRQSGDGEAKNLELLYCDICGNTFDHRYKLRQHRKAIHNISAEQDRIAQEKNDANEENSTIQDVNVNSLMYKRHIFKKSAVSKSPWKCCQCEQMFELDTERDLHEKDVHNLENNDTPFKCILCDKAYLINSDLVLHYDLEHRDKPTTNTLRCNKCKHSRRYATEEDLQRHIRTIHEGDKSRFKCHTCGKGCHSRTAMAIHMNVHIRPKPTIYTCNVCDKNFKRKKFFDKHMRKRHEGTSTSVDDPESLQLLSLRCHLCTSTSWRRRRFPSDEALKLHIAAKHNGEERPYKCQTCGKGFPKNSSLQLHMKFHTGERPFKCTLCDKSYVTQSDLNKHISSTHGANKEANNTRSLTKNISPRTSLKYGKKFVCNQCNQGCRNEDALKRHILRIHEGDLKPYKCKVCGIGSSTSSYLRLHMQKHTGVRLFRCELCSKSFTHNTYLTYHKIKEHGEADISIFQCKPCNKTFANVFSLRSHNKTAHQKVFSFICQICGYGCQFASTLKTHTLRHIGVKTIKCTHDGCSSSFYTKGQLNTHVRYVHTEERPFLCETCPASFTSIEGLKRHSNALHSGKTPYKCLICHKSYPIKNYLTCHMRSHKGKSSKQLPLENDQDQSANLHATSESLSKEISEKCQDTSCEDSSNDKDENISTEIISTDDPF